MSKKIDLRIIRTKNSIETTFLKLVQLKKYEEITIQDIADMALINRGTFYLHYSDKEDLLCKVIDKVLQEFKDIVDFNSFTKEDKIIHSQLQELIERLFENIRGHKDFYKVMLIQSNIGNFRCKLQEIIKQKFRNEFQKNILKNDNEILSRELFIKAIVSAFTGMTEWWLENSLVYSSHYMAIQLLKLTTKGAFPAAGFEIVHEQISKS